MTLKMVISSTMVLLSLLTILLLVVLLVPLNIWGTSSLAAQQVVKPPVTGIVTVLEDEVTELPNQRISWSTYWKLCWQPYSGAAFYELQAVTMEGISPKLHRLTDHCFRLQAATNENLNSQGLLNRELMLSLIAAQLSYRLRAVLDDSQVSEWSVTMPVGEVSNFDP
jgi:hypothetical protein